MLFAAAFFLFLSTPSARRATRNLFDVLHEQVISIHALREEGDICSLGYDQLVQIFLSTPSARRATYRVSRHTSILQISIHALREEGDSLFAENGRLL